ETDEAALAASREWKSTMVDADYSEDVHDPAALSEKGEAVSDRKWKAMGLISSDPSAHVRKLKALGQLGPTAIALMNVSGADPVGALRTYGREILPDLRD